MPELRIAASPADLDLARSLFREYERAVDTACCFEGFERELAEMGAIYGPPGGCVLLALDGGEAVGCAALRPLGDGAAEMKRLYLRPAARGRGLGGALVVRLLAEARALGHAKVVLETLPGRMPEAVALYQSLGFEEIPPYVRRPLAGARYLALSLG
ncbi:MAG TPA: GNAT family N-acetyltransferase [Anaeromyxobacteraceae bacterium]|nr:GNAT family N-acetyltransferase [Anaeromyxobacteraceae bacterium]